jgi:anti-sigma factor RsiW
MNHPKPEEWVPYVFGEATGAARRELRAHLRDCQQCREEVETWKRSLGRLDSWKLSRLRFSSELIFPVLKFAVAAAILLAVWISDRPEPARNSTPTSAAMTVAEFKDGPALGNWYDKRFLEQP